MKPSQKSLERFLMDRKRATCKICALPPAVKRQLAAPRDRRKADLNVVIEWLQTEWGITITREEYVFHNNGGHVWRKVR